MLRPRLVVALAALVTLSACGGGGGGGDDPDDGGGERTPTTIAVQTGNFQSARYGTAVATPPAVIVTDAQGPIPDFPVTFTVASGGGTITGGSATTNAGGVATLGSWTLGAAPGPNTLTATAGTRSVTITATAVTGTASTLTKNAGDGQSASVGTNVSIAPSVLVTDGTFPVGGVSVTFAVTGGGGSVTPATVTTNDQGLATTAWRLGNATGANTMTATIAGVAPVQFTATATPLSIGSVVKVAGDGVTGFPGNFTPTLPVAQVNDQFGQPVPGVAVTFTVTGGGGSLTYGSTTTNAQGRASPGSWRFGATGAQALTVTAPGGATASFTGTLAAVPSPSNYNIQLVFVDPQPTADQQAKFQQAVARWRNIITGDVPDIATGLSANSCGTPSDQTPALPAVAGPIDDVVIFAGVRNIDGPGQILAQAGPCLVRVSGRLTISGVVIFDENDVGTLEGLGSGIADVAFHEIGHVLGFGTLWSDFGLLQFPGTDGVAFSGPAAKQAFNSIQNPANPWPGSPTADIPVENTGGPGTRDGHWRETVFTREIMTGFYNSSVVNVFSAMSAASMRDLTYQVNDAASDAFTLSLIGGGNLRLAPSGTRLRESLAPWPIRVMDDGGRMVGEVRR